MNESRLSVFLARALAFVGWAFLLGAGLFFLLSVASDRVSMVLGLVALAAALLMALVLLALGKILQHLSAFQVVSRSDEEGEATRN